MAAQEAYYGDSKPTRQVICIHLDVSQDFSQKAGTDIPTLMDRHGGAASIRVLELPMASLRFSKQVKAQALQDPN